MRRNLLNQKLRRRILLLYQHPWVDHEVDHHGHRLVDLGEGKFIVEVVDIGKALKQEEPLLELLGVVLELLRKDLQAV